MTATQQFLPPWLCAEKKCGFSVRQVSLRARKDALVRSGSDECEGTQTRHEPATASFSCCSSEESASRAACCPYSAMAAEFIMCQRKHGGLCLLMHKIRLPRQRRRVIKGAEAVLGRSKPLGAPARKLHLAYNVNFVFHSVHGATKSVHVLLSSAAGLDHVSK